MTICLKLVRSHDGCFKRLATIIPTTNSSQCGYLNDLAFSHASCGLSVLGVRAFSCVLTVHTSPLRDSGPVSSHSYKPSPHMAEQLPSTSLAFTAAISVKAEGSVSLPLCRKAGAASLSACMFW